MSVRAKCTKCDSSLKLPNESFLERTLKCPRCKETMRPRRTGQPVAAPTDDDPFADLDGLLEQDRENPPPLAALPPLEEGTRPRRKRPAGASAGRQQSSGGGSSVLPYLAGVVGAAVLAVGAFIVFKASGGSLPSGEAATLAWLQADSDVYLTFRPDQLPANLPADIQQQIGEFEQLVRDDTGSDEFTIKDVKLIVASLNTESQTYAVAVQSQPLSDALRGRQEGATRKRAGGFTYYVEDGPARLGGGGAIARVGSDIILFADGPEMPRLLEAGPGSVSVDLNTSNAVSLYFDATDAEQASLPSGPDADMGTRAFAAIRVVRLNIASLEAPVRVNGVGEFSNAEIATELAQAANTLGPIAVAQMGVPLGDGGSLPSWVKIAASGSNVTVDLTLDAETMAKLQEVAAEQGGGGFPGGGMGLPF